MTKEELLTLIINYGDACEKFGDYQSVGNMIECKEIGRQIEKALDEIFSEKA